MMAKTEIIGHYEALRAAALAQPLGTDRRGLALLRREGMAAWAAAWNSCSAAPERVDVVSRLQPLAQPGAIVALLASMALSTLQEQPV
jgi:hypothetical protein